METAIQIVLFFLLIAEGGATRLLYNFVLKLQQKIGGKAFTAVSDVLTAVIGAGVMLITCLLLADSVRIFYAVFYIGGITLAHLLLTPKKDKDKEKCEKKIKVKEKIKHLRDKNKD